MKLIKVIIKPFKLEEVKNALIDIGIQGLTVIEVRGLAQQKGQSEDAYSNSDYSGDFIPKIMLEIAVPENMVNKTVNTVMRVAKTGKIGDGKIFVIPLEEAIHIRTEERGEGIL